MAAYVSSIILLSGLAAFALSQGVPCRPTPKPTELTLTVQGQRNATGHWTKDVAMDYGGMQSPDKWDVDFKETSIDTNGYSFTASASVKGSSFTEEEQLPSLRYVYRGDIKNFSDAGSVCTEMGARLAVINSEQESVHLGNLARISRDPTVARTPYTYIGFSFSFTQNQWMTVEGKSLENSGFARWETNQPSNSSFILQNGSRVFENCGSMGPEGRLNDSPCEVRLPFICEFQAIPCVPAANEPKKVVANN